MGRFESVNHTAERGQFLFIWDEMETMAVEAAAVYVHLMLQVSAIFIYFTKFSIVIKQELRYPSY